PMRPATRLSATATLSRPQGVVGAWISNNDPSARTFQQQIERRSTRPAILQPPIGFQQAAPGATGRTKPGQRVVTRFFRASEWRQAAEAGLSWSKLHSEQHHGTNLLGEHLF